MKLFRCGGWKILDLTASPSQSLQSFPYPFKINTFHEKLHCNLKKKKFQTLGFGRSLKNLNECMHTYTGTQEIPKVKKEIWMIFKAISWSQIALSKCIALVRQFFSSARFLAEAMFGCTNYLAEFFQAALNMKVLLVGQSFCFQSSIMKKICVNIVFLLCLLLLFCRKEG